MDFGNELSRLLSEDGEKLPYDLREKDIVYAKGTPYSVKSKDTNSDGSLDVTIVVRNNEIFLHFDSDENPESHGWRL